jgi:hypothetical protein
VPIKLVLTERHCYAISDLAIAREVRQALKTGDRERLDELIDFIVDVGDAATYTSELVSAEVKR